MRFQLIRTYRGHHDTICALAAVPGQPKIVSASRDGLMKVWDLRRDTSSILHEATDSYPTALYVFPAGFFAVSGTSNGQLKIWNLESGEVVRHLEGHQSMISSVLITRTGQRLISGSQDCTLRIWESLTGRALHVCSGGANSIEALALTYDGNTVLACEAGPDNTPSHIKAWHIETGRMLAEYDPHQIDIREMAILRDGQHIVSSSKNDDVILWNRETGAQIRQIQTHLGSIVMQLMPSEKSIVIGAQKPVLALWHLETGEKLYQFDEPSDQVTSIAVTTDGLYIIAGCQDGSLNFYMRVS